LTSIFSVVGLLPLYTKLENVYAKITQNNIYIEEGVSVAYVVKKLVCYYT